MFTDARDLAWGYIAYPPLTPALGHLSQRLFGASLDGFRFFAALALGQRPWRSWWDDDGKYGNHFHVAYIVRAVTPGRFALPAANVSDMYAPRIYGRTEMGSVTIAPK